MLRVENNAAFVKLPWSVRRMFTGRWAVVRGKKIYESRWTNPRIQQIFAAQRDGPVSVLRDGHRTLWFYNERFYWEDERLEVDDVKALILDRLRRRDQKLKSARSLMKAEEEGRPIRARIPTELRREVFQRDGGACIACGSKFDLQYDHVLPVARGGATTLENLQLLCADCNRSKSDSI